MKEMDFKLSQLPGFENVPLDGKLKPIRYVRQPGTLPWFIVNGIARWSGQTPPEVIDWIIKSFADTYFDKVKEIMEMEVER